jgi:hypothetical protein
MQLPLRIAILECDTPLDGTRAKYGGYGGVFTSLLNAAADSLGHSGLSSTEGMSITTWDVVEKMEYPQLEEVDAILLTGSSKLVSDYLQVKYTIAVSPNF